MNKKNILSVSIFLILIAFLAIYFSFSRGKQNTGAITSFEECVEAGFPIMESYPEQCNDGNETFTRDIGNELEKSDLIKINSPRPGFEIEAGKKVRITGEARGYWFFEGDFPFEIQDKNGNVLFESYATAEGDWMTEEFVPFNTTEFSLDGSYTGVATLILRRDNPSGLPENDDELIVPIIIVAGPEINLGDTKNSTGEEKENKSPELDSDKTPPANGCFIGGCSSQICSDEPGVVSTCEYREEYGCYRDATCERQINGKCGWTMTGSLRACLDQARKNTTL